VRGDRPADSPAMLSGRAHFRCFMPNASRSGSSQPDHHQRYARR